MYSFAVYLRMQDHHKCTNKVSLTTNMTPRHTTATDMPPQINSKIPVSIQHQNTTTKETKLHLQSKIPRHITMSHGT
jgi:hypothetical protein